LQEWMRTQLENGFSALAGSSATGTVRLHEHLVNELLTEYLKSAAAQVGKPQASAAPPNVRVDQLLKLITHASVHAEPGVISVDFTIQI
jgi:hypothetical protein